MKKSNERKIVAGREDDTSDYTVNAAARLGGNPLFTAKEDDIKMGLYLIGDDEIWVDVDAVNARRQELGIDENELEI